MTSKIFEELSNVIKDEGFFKKKFSNDEELIKYFNDRFDESSLYLSFFEWQEQGLKVKDILGKIKRHIIYGNESR